jgi:hypothetical protein
MKQRAIWTAEPAFPRVGLLGCLISVLWVAELVDEVLEVLWAEWFVGSAAVEEEVGCGGVEAVLAELGAMRV